MDIRKAGAVSAVVLTAALVAIPAAGSASWSHASGCTGTPQTGLVGTVTGTSGPDWFVTRNTDTAGVTFLGLGGADCLYGAKGPDVLTGGNGRDLLGGGRGADRLTGGNGPDNLIGDRGNDIVNGGPGNDVIGGDPGRDRVNGGPGNDDIQEGDRERDTITCGSGNDRIIYDQGLDVLTDAAACEVLLPLPNPPAV